MIFLFHPIRHTIYMPSGIMIPLHWSFHWSKPYFSSIDVWSIGHSCPIKSDLLSTYYQAYLFNPSGIFSCYNHTALISTLFPVLVCQWMRNDRYFYYIFSSILMLSSHSLMMPIGQLSTRTDLTFIILHISSHNADIWPSLSRSWPQYPCNPVPLWPLSDVGARRCREGGTQITLLDGMHYY